MSSIPFQDREQAALLLLPRLAEFASKQGVVIALPRGGVPMARLIADRLHWPLRLLLLKKLGHPVNPEYAIGVVTQHDFTVEDKELVSEDYLVREIQKSREVLAQREFLYGRDNTDLSLVKNKTALLIDDGIATGRSVLDAIRVLRQEGATNVVVAVPVSAPIAARKIRAVADRFIVLEIPDDFYGVGQAYASFPQVEDDEVIKCLDK